MRKCEIEMIDKLKVILADIKLGYPIKEKEYRINSNTIIRVTTNCVEVFNYNTLICDWKFRDGLVYFIPYFSATTMSRILALIEWFTGERLHSLHSSYLDGKIVYVYKDYSAIAIGNDYYTTYGVKLLKQHYHKDGLFWYADVCIKSVMHYGKLSVCYNTRDGRFIGND